MTFKEKVLSYLKINEDELPLYFQTLSEVDYGSPEEFKDMDKACVIIKQSMGNLEKIMIYGDYDADGIMATSILKNAFEKMNYQVGYYIPSRTIDGYGINLERAKQIVDKGYKLVITVDNGVNQIDAINFLKSHNVKVIVTDHHTYLKAPSVDAFLHPFEKDNKEENCGAYVAYMLSEALLAKKDYYLLSLASLATISDMMPLNMHNRNIVRLGIDYINNHKNHPFYLLHNCDEFDEEIFGFQIAPKINSWGRITDDTSINRIVKLFINSSFDEKNRIVSQLNYYNNLRKEELKHSGTTIKINESLGVVGYDATIKDGLVGLFASSFLNKYKKPSICFTKDKDGILKGSARSNSSCPINVFFDEIDDLLLTHGGHESAGGVTLMEKNLPLLIEKFDEYINKHPYQEIASSPIEIDIDEINYENYLFLKRLSPFGQGFKCPEFLIKIETKRIIKYDTFIKSFLNPEATLIYFNNDIDYNCNEIIFIGKLKKDKYKEAVSFLASKSNSNL